MTDILSQSTKRIYNHQWEKSLIKCRYQDTLQNSTMAIGKKYAIKIFHVGTFSVRKQISTRNAFNQEAIL